MQKNEIKTFLTLLFEDLDDGSGEESDSDEDFYAKPVKKIKDEGKSLFD